MRPRRFLTLIFSLLLILGLTAATAAQSATTASPAPAPASPAPAPKSACGPDHKIIYKRAVSLLDKAEKKLTARYTAEAESTAKEAKSLFAILQKECNQEQKDRVLTPKESQQQAINKKLAADELAQADELEKSAGAKFKKAESLAPSQNDMYLVLMREAKSEYEQAHVRNIKAMIYSLRIEQMLFSFLGR